jgi:competence protein ComGC
MALNNFSPNYVTVSSNAKTITPRVLSTSGFVLVEVMLFVLAICGLVLLSIPAFSSISNARKETKKVDVIVKVEVAKEQFDQESRPEERKKFDGATEPEKFSILAARLGPEGANPEKFIKGNGFKKITINKLGYDSDIQ